ncbi:hypothetical protein TYRP_000416 [Tyrophagus putrescentiae]|nr:hypothetical protein TYRP_000416 [Tyrophagus putrescentiae]
MKERRREYNPSAPCFTGILARCPERKDGDEDRTKGDLNPNPATRSPDDGRRDSDPWKNP